MEEILTPAEVAKILKIHVKTVYKLARDGTLAGNRIGRSWRFSKSQLMDLLSRDNRGEKKKGGGES